MKNKFTELQRQGYKIEEKCDCDPDMSELKEFNLINFNNKGVIKDAQENIKLYKKSE